MGGVEGTEIVIDGSERMFFLHSDCVFKTKNFKIYAPTDFLDMIVAIKILPFS